METDVETCDVCGFVWDEVSPAEITPRILDACEQFAQLLRGRPSAAQRPASERWSAVEYAQHVRDALLNLRDRIVLGAAEDNPVPHPMHGTPRIDLGLYEGDSAALVADELLMAADLFTRTVDRLPRGYSDRPIFYPYPRAATRTLHWVATQALHECEHHLGDARENVATLAG